MKKLLKTLQKSLKKLLINKKGFSITELMVATSILTTVGTISATKYDDVLAAARDANRYINTHQIQTAMSMYYLDHNAYPVCDNNNTATAACYQTLKKALEPEYMPEVPIDPLSEKEYVYKYWSNGKRAKIIHKIENGSKPDKTRVVWGI